MNSETGLGALETSSELRQRRTAAGAGRVHRLEALKAGLGPQSAAVALDPGALDTADEEEEEEEEEEKEERWADEGGGCEAEAE